MKTNRKVLIQYLYAKTKLVPYISYIGSLPIPEIRKIKGKIIGMVVAIDASVIGWSLCDKKDVFNKEEGLKIALMRADLVACISENALEEFYQDAVPFSLTDLVIDMNTRSIKYFQEQ